jgi:hypothetical protein
MSARVNGRFPAGRSGNPGGRPKRLAELEEAIYKALGDKVVGVLERLHELVHDPEVDERTAVAAAVAFLDRLLGKPSAPPAAVPEEDPAALDDDELWSHLLANPETAERVRAKLTVMDGGKR